MDKRFNRLTALYSNSTAAEASWKSCFCGDFFGEFVGDFFGEVDFELCIDFCGDVFRCVACCCEPLPVEEFIF